MGTLTGQSALITGAAVTPVDRESAGLEVLNGVPDPGALQDAGLHGDLRLVRHGDALFVNGGLTIKCQPVRSV